MEFQNFVDISFKFPIPSPNPEDKFWRTTKKDVNIAKPTPAKQPVDNSIGDAAVPDWQGAFGI